MSWASCLGPSWTHPSGAPATGGAEASYLGGTLCQDHDMIPSLRAKGARKGQAKAGGWVWGGGLSGGAKQRGGWG